MKTKKEQKNSNDIAKAITEKYKHQSHLQPLLNRFA